MTHSVAVVTGGSNGIGAAICGLLLARNATVINLDIVPPAETPTGDYHYYGVDLSKADETRSMAARVLERFNVNCLVNNAGVARPAHAITMICPFSAGTTSDIVARIVAQGLSRELRVPVIVEDRVGASGNIGMSLVAKAAPDGYTLGMGTISTHAINQALFAKMPYEIDEFVPLGIIGITPNLLVVPASSSIMTVGDLVAAAKANPGKLTFASSGNGTTGQLAGEFLKIRAGIDVVHAPYKDATRALTDLAAGHVDFMFYHPAAVNALIQAGRLRAIAVSSSTPSAAAPGIVPVDQQGIPDFDLAAWWAMYAPAGISREMREKLRDTLAKVLNDPQIKESLIARGFEPKPLKGDAIDQYLRQELVKWREIVRMANAKLD